MYRVDMSQRPDVILRGLINYDNNISLTSADIDFNHAGATELTHREQVKSGRNSRIMAYFKGAFSGSRQFFYNRINLNVFFGNTTAGAPHGECTNTIELLPYIRKGLGINIAHDEILFEYIDQDAQYCDVVILNTSIVYTGTVRVYFTGAPGSLPDQIRKTTLSGFTKDNYEVI